MPFVNEPGRFAAQTPSLFQLNQNKVVASQRVKNFQGSSSIFIIHVHRKSKDIHHQHYPTLRCLKVCREAT